MNILFYSESDVNNLKHRNEIFLKKGIPPLKKNGFEKSPFSTSLFGRNNIGSFSYEICKLDNIKNLQYITVEIVKGSSWIQIYLNIFRPHPLVDSLSSLNSVNGLHYRLPPCSLTELRLRSGDRKGPPIFYMFAKEHKLGRSFSEKGYHKRLEELGDLLESDMRNIDYYVERWYEIHKTPLKTTWEGIPIKDENV